MKRIFVVILTLLMAFSMLLGSYGRLRVQADDEDYGVEAWKDLRDINDCFYRRVNDNERTTDKTQLNGMANWINEKMTMFGYSLTAYDGAKADGNTVRSLTYRKAGNSNMRIVIGAHYDCAETSGCEDNGTGVALALELAKRFAGTPTNLTLEFCFFDGEEFLGMAGSYYYLEQVPDIGSILCYINLDCVGSGDNMYVYGGDYDESGLLVRSWGYNMAMTLAHQMNIDLREMPDGVSMYTKPTRTTASDQFYFNERGITYMYFEANAWLREDGTEGNPEKPYNYNSTLSAFADENGRIIHTKYDNLDVLESIVPGRIQSHLTDFSKVVSEVIRQMDENSPTVYAAYVPYPGAPETAEAETESTAAESAPDETAGENSDPGQDTSDSQAAADAGAETEAGGQSDESAQSGGSEAQSAESTAQAASEMTAGSAASSNGNGNSGSKTGAPDAATVISFAVLGICGGAFLLSVIKIILCLLKK